LGVSWGFRTDSDPAGRTSQTTADYCCVQFLEQDRVVRDEPVTCTLLQGLASAW